jgi:hypothetical protein
MSSWGRDHPCPCGSGRQFLECCGRGGPSAGISIRDSALTKLLSFAFHPAFDSDHSVAEVFFWGKLIHDAASPELRWLLDSEDATIKYNSWFLFDWEAENSSGTWSCSSMKSTPSCLRSNGSSCAGSVTRT